MPGDPDARQPPDANLSTGTVSFSWVLGEGLTCDQVAAVSVSVILLPTVGGFGEITVFSCEAMTGTSRSVEIGNYDAIVEIKALGGALGDGVFFQDVAVTANEDTDVGEIDFQIIPEGGLSVAVAAEEATTSCGSGAADGKITEIELRLKDASGTCVPASFEIGSGPDAVVYESDCAGSRTTCFESDVRATLMGLPSGPHALEMFGYRDALRCYAAEPGFTIPGGNLAVNLGTQTMAKDRSLSGC